MNRGGLDRRTDRQLSEDSSISTAWGRQGAMPPSTKLKKVGVQLLRN